MEVKIYGASDDLIELDGDISEEFGAYGSEATYLVFSDGTVISIAYASDDTACWRVDVIRNGTAKWLKTQIGDDEKDENTDSAAPPYSDVIVLTSDEDISLVKCTRDISKINLSDFRALAETQKVIAVLDKHHALDGFDEDERESLSDDLQKVIKAIVPDA